MLGEIGVTTQGNYHHNVVGDQCSTSMVTLWIKYAIGYGYVQGYMAPSGRSTRIVIVRYEDLVSSPEDVANALVAIGLPRKPTNFEAIDRPLSSNMNKAPR